MKTGSQVLELAVACVLLAYEAAIRIGWYSADVGPIMPFWIRIILPCLLLFPIRPREAAYWQDRFAWAVAIGLFLHDNALPRDLWIVRATLWPYLGLRAAMGLWKSTHPRAHA
jgi:hypothetical protein